MATHDSFKGISEFGESSISHQLKTNIVEYLKWGLLNIGAFYNVISPASGAYGGDFSTLRPVRLDGVNNGRIWETVRQDLVWESGLNYHTQPISISGVNVDGTFYSSSTSGTYAHYVDYPRGRVVFDSAISETSSVKMDYSYRGVSVYTSDAPFFRRMLFNSFRVDDAHFAITGSGNYNVPADNRVQLPCIFVEIIPRRRLAALQIGGGQIVDQDVLFHIFAETEYDRDSLVDIISMQNNKTILLYDNNAIAASGAYPLHPIKGSLQSVARTYPQFLGVSGPFFWKKGYLRNMTVQNISIQSPLFRGMVRGNIEIVRADI